ncbi:MAG: ABC transporter ATP-binding protein/permease [Clostridia bacterium]|nr:ABC transporter ATP-binding protein/permease [Clostridia bacterium]
MLELRNIVKNYYVGDTTVEALKGVSIKFRESEFVSILGPSGCGKTTLLNIIGGLDKYTSGDLIINEKSTKEYGDRDWDTYRNHSVGFVFQNYNLIPHQTVLENVEIALTLSGIGVQERRERAISALEKVGLKDKLKSKPNQLSGGQMQRVAIARALVNDPDILLADEPTGALDSTTSVQVMELLKEISKDRLIIMVTHNPQLADEYSTRIIKILDGQITDDSAPFDGVIDQKTEEKAESNVRKTTVNKGKKKRTSMSFWTALSLSFKNLMTKKGRTFLTSFAGSIGIIGIALILSLSSGFQRYINKVQEDTLSNYPVSITEQAADVGSMLTELVGDKENLTEYPNTTTVTSKDTFANMLDAASVGIATNDLKSFKSYLTQNIDMSKVSAIQYTYNLDFDVYAKVDEDKYEKRNAFDVMALMNASSPNSSMMMGGADVFSEMIDNHELIKEQYDLIDGNWNNPNSANQALLVIDKYNQISDYDLYNLGIDTGVGFKIAKWVIKSQMPEATDEQIIDRLRIPMIKQMLNSQGITYTIPDDPTAEQPSIVINFNELIGKRFNLLSSADKFTVTAINGGETSSTISGDALNDKLDNSSLNLEIVGIVRLKEEASTGCLKSCVVYSKALTNALVARAEEVLLDESSLLYKQKVANPDFNYFDPTGEGKWSYTVSYGTTELEVNDNYESNLEKLGLINFDNPASINIYPTSFENKDYINDFIANYNKINEDDESKKITYTDYLGIMMSSISTIIDAISYILIGFVSVSLVVSSIMIGIITYISVLERIKEIGILRAVGASKKDISRVFNAETLIIGFVSGVIGIGTTLLLTIPVNLIIDALAGIGSVAKLPTLGGVILVLISMALTLVAGLVPSRIASKKDPVVALRSE